MAQVFLVHRVGLALRGQKVALELLGLRVKQDSLVLEVLWASQDGPDHKDRQDRLAGQVHKVLLAGQVHKVLWVSQDGLVVRVHKVSPDSLVYLAEAELLDSQDLLVHKVPRASLDGLELRAPPVTEDHKASLDGLGLRVKQVRFHCILSRKRLWSI